MTHEEKADEILSNYSFVEYDQNNGVKIHNDTLHAAKRQCAIICVEQVIDSLEAFAYTGTFYDHFETGKMVTTEQASPTEYYRSVLEHIKNS